MKRFSSNKNTIINIVIILVLISVLLYTFISGGAYKDAQLYYQCLEKADSIQLDIYQYSNTALAMSSVFAQSQEVRTAYSYDDTTVGAAYLQEYMQPLVDQAGATFEVDPLKVHFHKPPATSFLRTWTDKNQDDLSSFRETVLKVYETKEPLQGIEAGRGGFAFRGISPIFNESEYIGSVEVFFEPYDLVFELELNEFEEIYFTIYDEIVDNLFWEETKKEYDYDKKGDYYFFSSSTDGFSDYYLDTEVLEETRIKDSILIEDTDYYMIAYIPVYDFSSNGIGCIVYMLDKYINTQQGLTEYIAIILSVALIIFMFIRLQNEIKKKTLLQQAQNETIFNLNDVTQKLHRLSSFDSLTNLYNRRGISAVLNEKLGEFNRYGVNFSIILCDVDKFKQINDTYGHECGDAALKWISNVLRSGTRQNDAICRWGGDELLIVLSNTSYEQALQAAKKFSQMISSNEFRYNNRRVPLTMTFGVATIDNNIPLTDIVSGADKALYYGKQNGRNRVYGVRDL